MNLEIVINNLQPMRTTVALGGKLDAMSYLDFDKRIDPVIAQIPRGGTLVLDLASLDYISSAGLRSVFRARKAMKAHGGQSLVVNTQPQVRKVFDIVKAVPVNEIFSTVAELDAYLDQMQKKVLKGEEDDDA
jgi:sigma-B regulation protein RsbU (phosphoserine phosphatase)